MAAAADQAERDRTGHTYAELVGRPLDGLLIDITGWTAEEIQIGAAPMTHPAAGTAPAATATPITPPHPDLGELLGTLRHQRPGWAALIIDPSSELQRHVLLAVSGRRRHRPFRCACGPP
ncbi:hypothetical protein ACFV4Q_36400 [Streptomyces nojiriensis]|uniref:hypothetical protein n=1 Tax=Streptomyces nojiriensis TaxID=66374 RepID=UPI0036483E2C